MMVDWIWLEKTEIAAMIAEYDKRGTCTCPRCKAESQPWNGLWACDCGACATAAREVRNG